MRLTLLTTLIMTLMSVSACQTLEELTKGFTPIDKSGSLKQLQIDNVPAPCPTFSIIEDLNTFYEIPKTSDPKEDVGFSMAKISDIKGACSNEDSQLVINIDLEFEALPGPFSKTDMAANDARLSAPYFVAVVDENKKIIAKDVFDVVFDLNKVAEIDLLHRETLKQIIPMTGGRQPEKYQIMAGFQLDEDQLQYARQRRVTEITPAAGENETTGGLPDPLAMAE